MPRSRYTRPDRVRDPAIYKYVQRDNPTSLIDYHFVVPMPRAVSFSAITRWCRENIAYGWIIQLPRMGQPSWKNTVLLFEAEDDLTAFRDHYCYDQRYHKRPHEADWMDAVGENE